MNIIIFGPQGSGKGTQADKLAEKFNLSHIETGQIFRDIAKLDSPLGIKIRELGKSNELIMDEITVDVVEKHVKQVPKDKGVILDSAPRTLGQIEPVERIMKAQGRSIDKAIYISLPYGESVARITRRFACMECTKSLILGKHIELASDVCPFCGGQIVQRSDDTPEGIVKRLDIFYNTTMPVVEAYRKKGLLIEVDGGRGMEEVFEDIIKQL
jgi:adenylate kinase